MPAKAAEPGYGLPLRCPKCPPEHFFGMLKTPGNKAVPCPNCGSKLEAVRKTKKGRSKRGDGRGLKLQFSRL